MPTQYDTIIVGGGHNGLVTAAYLARAGQRVLVLERRHVLGGACCTEELFPGFHVSTAAYVNGLFRREIIEELRLAEHGFQMLIRDPSSFTPLLDGRSLIMGPNLAETQAEIAKFSTRDAQAIVAWEAMLDRVTATLCPLLLEPPGTLESLGRQLDQLSPTTRAEVFDVLTGSATDLLERYFHSEPLKATLATDGVIGSVAPPSAQGTAYVLFHHVFGETFGNRGVWSYVKGGMGVLSAAIASAARAAGAEIHTEMPVARLLVREGAVAGVVTEDGREFLARRVASNLTAEVTFRRLLLPDEQVRWLPPEFRAGLDRIDYRSASVKINVALSGVPSFACRPTHGAVGPHHRGTFHIAPNLGYIERAYDDAKYGRMSAEPIIEGALPTAVDASLAPPGCHILSLFTQYAPYRLAEGVTDAPTGTAGSWDDSARARWADRVFDVLERYAPGFKRLIIDCRVYAPPDLENVFGLTGGSIFHGAMSLRQLLFLRPMAGWANYRSPIRGLYLCGSATSPGGGVMGVAGRNAARVILADEQTRQG